MKKFIMILSCLAAGPMELFIIYQVLGSKTTFFKLMGSIVLFSIVARILYTIIFTVFVKAYDDIWDTDLTICVCCALSYFLSTFILAKFITNQSLISAIFQSILFLGGNFFGYITTYYKGKKPKSKKITATTFQMGRFSETTYRDEYGDKVGEASSFDYGFEVDTTIKDKDGNETKIERMRF